MKGPGYKLSHDVRRVWKCPACGAERKLPGDATSLTCGCRTETTYMKLIVERTVAPRPFQVVRDHDIRSSEFGIEDMPVLQPHPDSLPPERSSPRRPRPESSSEAVAKNSEIVDTNEVLANETEATPQTSAEPDSTLEKPEEQTEEEWGEGIF